ncbi:MAG: CoA transferase, partial [Ignavibacteriales bacterium]
GPVLTLQEAARDPQVRERDDIVEVRHELGGVVSLVRNPIRMSATPVEEPRSPPLLGQHVDELLGGLLGLGAADIDSLRARGAIGPKRQQEN